MKYTAIIVFLLFFLSVCGYVGWRIWHILPFFPPVRWIAVGVLLLFIVCFFTNFIFGLDSRPMPIAITLYELGNSSVFIGLYLAMLFLVLDMGRLLRLVPRSLLYDSRAGTASVAIVMTGLFVYGYLHYLHKERVPLTLTATKTMRPRHRMVMMTDLHLGYHNRADEFRKWVDSVNREQPELVLIAGDIVDGSIRALAAQGMAAEFRRLKAPVYACLGNHEYLGGASQAKKFYQDAGIHLLVDSHALVHLPGGDRLLVVGRDDRTNKRRAGLQELMRYSPKGYYTILMDHQPYHLEEAQQCGIDFQLSGHTHYGQVWPVSWIEDLIYEDAFGPLRKGDTQYYVSSGIGIWGGKFRIGTRSEYIVAELQ